jgi:hypothetical protein
MATILDFRAPAAGRPSETAAAKVSGSAELIFFPGIRYERTEIEPPSQARKSGGRTRDLIELLD